MYSSTNARNEDDSKGAKNKTKFKINSTTIYPKSHFPTYILHDHFRPYQ